jgi:hypothetical protein
MVLNPGSSSVRDGRHQFSVDETVYDIETVRADEQREDPGERQFRSPSDLGPRERSDRRNQPRRNSTLGRSLGLPYLGEWAVD